MDLDTLLQGRAERRRWLGSGSRPAGACVIRDGEVTWKPAIDITRLAAIAAVAYVAARLLTRT